MRIVMYMKRTLAFGFYVLCGGILFATLLLGMNSHFYIYWYWLLLLMISCFGTLVLGTHFLCSSFNQIEDKIHCALLVYRFMFVIYIFLIIFILFIFNYQVSISVNNAEYKQLDYLKEHSNFIPFTTLFQYISGVFNHTLNTSYVLRNTLGNFFLFVPMGLFLPGIFKTCKDPNKFILAILIIRILFEILQVLFKVGVFDVDDILLSFFGAIISYKVYHLNFFQYFIKKVYLVES